MQLWLIFLIMVTVMIAVYFVFGTTWRYRRGLRRCPEMLPNYQFWSSVGRSLKTAVLTVCTCGSYTPPASNVVALPTTESAGFFHRVATNDPAGDVFDIVDGPADPQDLERLHDGKTAAEVDDTA
jgi:hypothetical protein